MGEFARTLVVGRIFWFVGFRLGHSNVFICFASFENPKTYQPAREKNKQEKISKSVQIYWNCV
jgi:hypothetical protein